MIRRAGFALATLVAVATSLVAVPRASGADALKPLDYHAYSAWRRVLDVRLSRDGRRIAYAEVPAEADADLLVRDLRSDALFRAARGRAPQFTPDGRFVVYRIAAPVADVKAADRAGKTGDDRPKDGLGIADVTDVGAARATEIPRVRSFALARDGATVGYLLEPTPAPSPSASPAAPAPSPRAASAAPSPAPGTAVSPVPSASPHAAPAPASPAPSASPKGPGRDAPTSFAWRRADGPEIARVPNVTAYAVSADGARIAYVVQTKADESIHVRDTDGTHDRTLAHGTAHIVTPVLSPNGTTLAYLADPEAYGDAKREKDARAPLRLMVADIASGTVTEAFGPSTSGVASRTFATDANPPQFSADGSRLAFWTANVPQPRPGSAPPRIDLDFWYWRDGKLPTQQRHEAADPKNNAYLTLYDVASRRVVALADAHVTDVFLAGDARYALGVTNVPYEKLTSWDDAYYDVYRIDAATGARTLLARKVLRDAPRLSPSGRYAVAYDAVRRAYYTLRMRDGRKTWITDARTVRAWDEEDDHPAPPPPYGIAGWTPGDRDVLLYDRYDVWSVSPDGGRAVNLTGGDGRRTKRIYRVLQPRTDEPVTVFRAPRPVFEKAPYVLTFTDDRTKATGFAALDGLRAQTPHVTMRVDKRIGPALRARDATDLVFAEERFDEFPDLWTSAASPASARRISDANPQAAQYGFGSSRLIEYRNGRGRTLRAVLTTPPGFDRHKRYPMLVYVYEKMSDGLHTYVTPASGTVVNLARYASRGYVVLQPDITYRIGHTTASAVDCVSSAVRTVVGMGFVDPARIGMAGHSYGGYEVNALVTHTNLFRAVESGASDSDLPSLYGGFWETGDVQQSYYERSQGRIGATPWARPDLYVENSPLFFVDRVRAPYLRIQDDQDGAVPYGQGVEFFSALRRAGKEAYMFTFIGEGHGLVKQPNKDYWTLHLDEFFDHFLLGAPAPEWMTHAGSYEHRGERDVEPLFTPATFPPGR